MNEEVRLALKEKKVTFAKYSKTKDGRDYREYAKARNRARAVCRKAVKNYEKAIAREAQHNPKAFYAYANSKMKTKEGVADLLDEEGKTITNNKEKANILNNFFCSVFTEENIKDMPECEDRHVKTELGDIVFIKDIVIKKLK